MEYLCGKKSGYLGGTELRLRLQRYREVWIDVGTGDGQFVQHLAQTQPENFYIGIDACRENLRQVSRNAPPNALYLIANALALPDELENLAEVVTINFPWGSLLGGLLENQAGLMAGLARIARPEATLEIRLNGNALLKAGWTLESGGERVRQVLNKGGFATGAVEKIEAEALRNFSSSWAKRLAYGREPHALYMEARAGVLANL